MLRELGVRQSLSNPGTPHDNAVMESFFATLKREELSHNWYNTPEELDKTIREYIDSVGFNTPTLGSALKKIRCVLYYRHERTCLQTS
ncbi:MAG: integrase core domain-containing protein [Treponema sp.]|nr:integrase core domain-containing protein [Treponema sp.]